MVTIIFHKNVVTITFHKNVVTIIFHKKVVTIIFHKKVVTIIFHKNVVTIIFMTKYKRSRILLRDDIAIGRPFHRRDFVNPKKKY